MFFETYLISKNAIKLIEYLRDTCYISHVFKKLVASLLKGFLIAREAIFGGLNFSSNNKHFISFA